MIDSLHKYPVFPDLLENQKRSLHYFWKKGILEELELFSYLSRSNAEDFHENSQNGAGSQRKNQTPVFSFLSRGVTSLSSKSFFQFQKQNEIQKRTTRSNVFFNPLSFPELKKTKSTVSSTQKSEAKAVVAHSFSPQFRFQNRRPLQFSFGSSVFKDFPEVSFRQEGKNTHFKSAFFHPKEDQDLGKNSKIIIHGSKFLLKTPQYSKQEAIRGQKTYSVGLYIPVELVENLSSSKLASSNHETSDSFSKIGQNGSLFETQFASSITNSENSKVFAFSNVCDPSDRFSFLGTSFKNSEFLGSKAMNQYHERNKNNPRHVVGGLGIGFTSLAQHSLSSEVFEETSPKRDQLDQELKPRWFYFGDIPLMTERGSFLINGAPRVLVNQIIRCPSVYFKLKLDSKNRRSFIASFLSEYGSWLRLETDRLRSRIWVRIDKSPRFPLDWLLSALGWSSEQSRFHSSVGIGEDSDLVSSFETSSTETKTSILGSPKTISKSLDSKTQSCSQTSFVNQNQYLGKMTKKTPNIHSSLIGIGERLGKTESTHQEATQLIWKKCNPSRWTSFIGCYSFFYTKFFHPRRYSLGNLGRLSLNKRLGRRRDCEIPTLTPEDIFLALDYLIQLQNGNESAKFYLDDIDHLKNRRVRLPGEIIQNQFRLALSRLSGVVLNSLNSRTKTQGSETLPISFSQLSKISSEVLRLGSQTSFENQEPNQSQSIEPHLPFGIRETQKGDSGTTPIQGSTLAQIFGGSPPQSFVSTLRELFNTSQLSQYMDQTNPLAEITHKRRLTSLGPGGVGRDQAGFAVREIHPSHFGRICPIETPEGQNAGLVGSLASYARINADGFLQSPAMTLLSATLGSDFEKKGTDFLSKKSDPKPIYLFSAEAEDEIYLCTADIGAVTAGSRIRSLEMTKNDSRTEFGKFDFELNQADEPVPIRFKQEFIATSAKKIQYTGICPIQMISVATSLIPFLEHDDANRALMGSNMQRQAVPLVFPEKAFVGTGLEMQAARDSSTPLISSVSGQIQFVDARRIEIRHESNQSKTFDLLTYARSNQSTSIHHRPAVQLNEWVEKGDILADGSATHHGELSLGKNLLLAYMPWEGYNFEDAIVINERLVYDDVYTSLHVERYEVDIRNAQPLRLALEFQATEAPLQRLETKPQGSNQTIDLEDSHLAQSKDQLGTNFPGEAEGIDSGSQTKFVNTTVFSNQGESKEIPPKFLVSPSQLRLSNQEQSLEKLDMMTKSLSRNNSKQNLTMEIGKEYITRDLDLVFGGRPTSRVSDALAEQSSDLSQAEEQGIGGGKLDSATFSSKSNSAPSQDRSVSESRNFSSQISHLDAEGIIQPGTWVKEGDILVGKITPTQRTKISSGQSPPEYRLLVAIFADGASKIESSFNIRFKNTSFKAGIGVKGRVIDCIIPWRPDRSAGGGDSLRLPRSSHRQTRKSAPIQIFLAHKKRIQLGDKMSGRHGNKGIVSLILPPHDMPYTQDGKPIDVVLNPLGVPSRMNVGQVLESLLGLVSAASHEIYRLMPFDEMYGSHKKSESFARPETSRSIVYSKLQTTRNLLGKAAEWYFDPNNPGKTQLFDGRTGEVFHQPALLGYSYMFKLIHLVDDKIHARSTGPYSLVTQQPLGGRSKKGGQRLGEMEVWALEGFGAAYILQEFLTVKSDEIYSRNTFLLDLMKRKTEESKASLISTIASVRGFPAESEKLDEVTSSSDSTHVEQFENEDFESRPQFLESKASRSNQYLRILKTSDRLNLGSSYTPWSDFGTPNMKKQMNGSFDSRELPESPRMPQKIRPTNESRVPESFRVLVNELQALCLSVYYNPDFRLSYPSLLGWDGVFLLASKKFPTSSELSHIKNIGF
jgi:DNA-directed RNA polymerase beta subunit